MKKILIIGAVVVIAIILIIQPDPPFGANKIPVDVIYDTEPVYDWEQYLSNEDTTKRTHITRDYAHPTDSTKRIKIQSSVLLNYSENGEFKDLLPLPFPEGKAIGKEKDKHFMMNLPEWGTVELKDNEKVN